VALVGIRMPTHPAEGLVAADDNRQNLREVGVLVLSQYVDLTYALRLLNESPGAVGYLIEDRIGAVVDIIDTLKNIATDEAVIDQQPVADLTTAPGCLHNLTNRERQVLALLAEGHTDRGIAQILYVTRKTVEAHVRSIFDKLDVPVADTENRRVHAVLTYLREASRMQVDHPPRGRP